MGDAVAALWRSFDRGSWVMPQLAAVAYLADPEFAARARTRIEHGCPLDRSRRDALSALQRHVFVGPGGFGSRSGKGLNSLIYLSSLRPAWSSWLQPLAGDSELQRIRAEDFDHGDQIAARWLARFVKLTGVHSP
jgi:hypothetical protein